MGLEPGAAGWKVQTNPLSYGGTPGQFLLVPDVLFLITSKEHTRCVFISLEVAWRSDVDWTS